MTTQKRTQTKTHQSTRSNHKMLQMALFGFVAAFVGFMAALALMLPLAHQQLASARSLDAQFASTQTATNCIQPSMGKVASATTSSKPQGGSGGFIKQLVGGQLALHASIHDTGPSSENKIVAKVSNTVHVENTNTISFVVNSSQSASSGSANVSDNTSAGGAYSGIVHDDNHAAASVAISN